MTRLCITRPVNATRRERAAPSIPVTIDTAANREARYVKLDAPQETLYRDAMPFVDALLSLLDAPYVRAQLLIPMVAGGVLIGELLARYSGVSWVFARYNTTARRFARKLDRPERGIATRLYRGIAALLILLIPVLIFGVVIAPFFWPSALLMVALIGVVFSSRMPLKHWRAARSGTLTLSLPGEKFLFADTHGVLRALVLHTAEEFARTVGLCVWYILGGVPLALGYLAVLQLARAFERPVFGWAARGLLRIIDALPRIVALILLTLAALFVAHAKPLAIRHARTFHGAVAHLLDVSLGGPLPWGNLPWQGSGTPKLVAAHLGRMLLLRGVATVLLLLMFASSEIVKLLKLLSYS